MATKVMQVFLRWDRKYEEYLGERIRGGIRIMFPMRMKNFNQREIDFNADWPNEIDI